MSPHGSGLSPPFRVIRPLLAITLAASGLKLLGASNLSVAMVGGALAALSVVHHALAGQRDPGADAAGEAS